MPVDVEKVKAAEEARAARQKRARAAIDEISAFASDHEQEAARLKHLANRIAERHDLEPPFPPLPSQLFSQLFGVKP